MTRHIVYSFGYQGQDIDLFARKVTSLRAMVVDTRIKPFSRVPTWNRSNLERLLTSRYRWLESLGNLNYKGGPIVLKDLEAGVADVTRILQTDPVVLLCICADVRVCHRGVILERLRKDGFMTTALASVAAPATKASLF